jgi:hypothetical protein
LSKRSDSELIDAVQRLHLSVGFEEETHNVSIADAEMVIIPISINSDWRSAVNEALDILEIEAADIFDVEEDGDMGEETK